MSQEPCPAIIGVAGRLAELGAARLRVEAPGRPAVHVGARETDLPGLVAGLLRAHGSVALVSDDPPARVEIDAGGALWVEPPARTDP